MSTIAPTTTTANTMKITAVKMLMLPVRMSSIVLKMAAGSPTTIPAKMIREMPLPTPRSVICSPSHMTKAVPVVSVRTVRSRNPHPGDGTRGAPPGAVVCSRKNEMPIDWMIDSTTVP